MYRGEKAEQIALEYIKANFDPEAKLFGGMNANQPDIICSLGVIEVKGLPAQCGQFTYSTKHLNPYSEKIINEKNPSQELCKQWIAEHYKNVNYFCIVEKDLVSLYSTQDFLSTFSFSVECRAKKSGSRVPAKKTILPSTYWKDGRLYHNFLKKEYLSQDLYVNDNGEVRKLSLTKNKTYIFSVVRK